MSPLARSVWVLVATFVLAPHAPAQLVYSNDFDAPEFVGLGATASLTGAATGSTVSPYTAYGDFAFSSSSTTPIELSLTNLPPHTAIDVGFLGLFLDSWDSYDGNPTPDSYDLYVDGSLVASYTYNNASGSIKDIDGGALVAEYVQFDTHQFYSDTVVDFSGDPGLVLPHTASTLTVQWIASGAGWQGADDEEYGLDNLTVELLGVPEPGAAVLALAALPALGRRRA